MARYTEQPFGFFDDSSSLESKPVFSEEDGMSVLDDKMLEPTTTTSESSSLSDPRRPSYDQNMDGVPYQEGGWTDYQASYQQHMSHPQSRQNSQVSHPIFDAGSSNFMQETNGFAQQSAWHASRSSGSCTPTPTFEQFSSDYDANQAAGFAAAPMAGVNFSQVPFRTNGPFGLTGGVAMSPQSSQGWMQSTSDLPDSRPQPSRSPTYRNDPSLHMRRDGIRKKNARFEIPAERTLSNIDQLIAQSTNDEEIKELKQQKRLLRNRQAALDSRQRKKLHTEKLEEEKKQYTSVITDLEEALHSMKLREADLLREKSEWMATQQQLHQYIEGLHMEKDELIRSHTLETADLRKKNNILREAVEKLDSQLQMTNNSNFPPGYSEFDNLAMEAGTWDDFHAASGLHMEADALPTSAADNSMSIVPIKSDKAANRAQEDLPFSWNAFYMCLLFGAFIASNSTSFSNTALPQLSEEYRAESANVLKAVLASAAPDVATSGAHASFPSASHATHLPTTITGAQMAEMTAGAGLANQAPSNLEQLHNNLAMPSKQQEDEQVFALNVNQYNSLTTFEEDDLEFKPHPPSNLQQALAAMRSNGMQRNKATSDVYSRSLLWDRLPAKVVNDFRRMVRECGGLPVNDPNHHFGAP